MKRIRVFSPAGRRWMHILAWWMMAVAFGAGVATQAADLVLRLTASSQTLGAAAGIGRDVEIGITRWSTESERQTLVEAFVDQGPWRALDVLHDAPSVGRLKVAGMPGYDLRFAARCPLPDGGERLILMTDRPMGPWITWTQVPVSDYPFALIEVHLDQNGGGVGKLSLTTRVMYDDQDRIVALERYATAPVWLQNVRIETRGVTP